MIRILERTLAFDTETTGLWPWPTESRKALGLAPDMPFLFSLANLEGETVFFRGEVDPRTRRVSYDRVKSELTWLRKLVSDPTMRIVMHNAPFDMSMGKAIDFDWKCVVDDTKVAAHTARPTEPSLGLKRLSRVYLEIPDDDEKRLKESVKRNRQIAKAKGWAVATEASHGKKKEGADYWLADRKLLEDYAVRDAYRTIGLHLFYQGVIEENRKRGGRLWEIYRDEMKCIWATFRMACHGIGYRRLRALELLEYYRSYEKQFYDEILSHTWKGFKPRSDKDLYKAFVEVRGYKVRRETDKGNPSLDGAQLKIWAKEEQDRLAQAINEWKSAQRAVKELLNYERHYCVEADGRTVIHPAWNQTGPRTGRYSCQDPNLMQLTGAFSGRKRASIDTKQRECFGPWKGRAWYQIDYSQIEVWIFAFASKDPVMMQALLNGEDFHSSTAKKAFGSRDDYNCKHCASGVPMTDGSHGAKGLCTEYQWRRRAKLIFFSKIYGGGIKRIATLIGCPYAEAKRFVAEFDHRLPNVERYMKRVIHEVSKTDLLINLFGREYEIEPDKRYKAVNWNIQGSAAEVMKRSLRRVSEMLLAEWPEAGISATIHDELIIDLPLGYHSKKLLRQIIVEMQRDQKDLDLPKPLSVSVKVVREHLLNGKKVKV